MFRRSIVVLILVAIPIVADAQSRGRSHQSRGRSARAEALARPDALAEVLLPAGEHRHTPPRFQPPRDWWGRPLPQTDRGRSRHQRFGRYPFGSYYAVPYTGYSTYAVGGYTEYEEPAPPATMTKGLVRLELTPAVAGLEYVVDGLLIGSSSNLGTEFELNAGARQIEIRARGYKPLVFDARIEIGRVTPLRGTLEAIEQPQAPRSTGSRIMYVIPGCYIGNSKPEPAALPAGCDVRKMITRGNGL